MAGIVLWLEGESTCRRTDGADICWASVREHCAEISWNVTEDVLTLSARGFSQHLEAAADNAVKFALSSPRRRTGELREATSRRHAHKV